jgi:hypothetical protein
MASVSLLQIAVRPLSVNCIWDNQLRVRFRTFVRTPDDVTAYVHATFSDRAYESTPIW